jgi:hypothetical protein
MQTTPIYERVPLVWVLIGLLFNATGLYLGFEFALSFVYLMVGWFCCAFGVAIYVLRLRERPEQSASTRLSPNFVSAGAVIPSMADIQHESVTEQSDTE